jgi:chromosomal replication initiation ATPase DnaA
VPDIAQDDAAQTALFHLHNMLQSAGHLLLLTGRAAPSHWNMSLPDLQSRVDASGHAALEPPDDALLGAVLAKLLSDRQLRPRPDVIPYLLTRMNRSFAAAGQIIKALDAGSLAQKRDITRAFASEILDNIPDDM